MRTFTLSFFLVISLVACKKDSAREQDDNGNYIDKMYFLSDDGNGMDTTSVLTVNYDVMKRVTTMTDGLDHDWNYFYNGNDMNPYKATIFSYGGPEYTVFYTYNSAGLKTRDSALLTFPFYTVATYNYTADKIYGYQYFSAGDEVRDTATLDANGNIINNNRHSVPSSIYSQFTYDNHPHPFSAMNIFNSNRELPFGETFLLEMFTPNNRLTQTEVSNTGGLYEVTYTYEYNSNGFPTKITANEGGDIEITLITYRSL